MGYSRPAMDRMYRIHELLRTGAFPNCTHLSREFEVVVRTVKRDIDFMRTRMNLPIDFDTRRNGYFYTRPVEHFPQLPTTEAELFALLVAHKAIAQYHGTPFEQPLQAAFRKLTRQLDDSVPFSPGDLANVLSFHPFAPGDSDLKDFEIVATALRQRRALTFHYRNRSAARSAPRQVHPYHLACIQNQWYLIGFDQARNAMRTFALARLRQPALTSERFKVPRNFHADQYLAGSFGVFKGQDDYDVVLDFDPWAADEVRGRRWHHSQELIELPGGRVRLRMRLNSLEEVERWLLGMGTHATVARPRALAERLRKTSQEISLHYSRPVPGV
jgi:predicted DNA-binding transcriptional regulator YafY